MTNQFEDFCINFEKALGRKKMDTESILYSMAQLKNYLIGMPLTSVGQKVSRNQILAIIQNLETKLKKQDPLECMSAFSYLLRSVVTYESRYISNKALSSTISTKNIKEISTPVPCYNDSFSIQEEKLDLQERNSQTEKYLYVIDEILESTMNLENQCSKEFNDFLTSSQLNLDLKKAINDNENMEIEESIRRFSRLLSERLGDSNENLRLNSTVFQRPLLNSNNGHLNNSSTPFKKFKDIVLAASRSKIQNYSKNIQIGAPYEFTHVAHVGLRKNSSQLETWKSSE
jgi:hypothetical protein